MKRLRADDGVSLLEILLAVAIMGIAFAAIVGGMYTYVVASDVHRKQAVTGALLRSAAEDLKTRPYVDCATPGQYAPTVPGAPSGYALSVTAVQYWNGSGFGGTCPADTGLQLLTLQVQSADRRSSETLGVVKRKP
jgi:prepilin-type N-terminal cleavage/methylation domain-containing protein